MMNVCPLVADKLRSAGVMSTVAVRKLFNSIGIQFCAENFAKAMVTILPYLWKENAFVWTFVMFILISTDTNKSVLILGSQHDTAHISCWMLCCWAPSTVDRYLPAACRWGRPHTAWTTSRCGQDSLWKIQSEWQRTEINRESTSMVCPSLGSRTAKEQNFGLLEQDFCGLDPLCTWLYTLMLITGCCGDSAQCRMDVFSVTQPLVSFVKTRDAEPLKLHNGSGSGFFTGSGSSSCPVQQVKTNTTHLPLLTNVSLGDVHSVQTGCTWVQI